MRPLPKKNTTFKTLNLIRVQLLEGPNSRLYPFKFFKGCLTQILLGPFLNTFSRLIQPYSWYGVKMNPLCFNLDKFFARELLKFLICKLDRKQQNSKTWLKNFCNASYVKTSKFRQEPLTCFREIICKTQN